MSGIKPSTSSATPRGSGQELQKDEDKRKFDPVQQQGEEIRLEDLPTARNNGATVIPFSTAAFVSYATVKALRIMERSLTLRRVSTRVANLNTRLIESIAGGDTVLMSSIMADGANPNATCRLDDVSACHLAAMYDNDALELLLTKGADSSRSDRHGRTPLHLAAWTGNVKQIAVLLNFPEALRKSVVDHVLSPETLKAVSRHSVPVNKLTNVPCYRNVGSTLLDKCSDGLEHNCRNVSEILPVFQEGGTPLHAASARAQHHCVQLLLAAGANPSEQDVYSRTALDVAGCAHYMGLSIDENNFMETVDLLLKAGGHFLNSGNNEKCFNTPLHTAVELGSEAAVKQLLQGGASATAWNSRGLTAMHMCVEKRNKELLQLLANKIKKSNNPSLLTVDVKDRTGSTVLCAAVKAEWMHGVCIALEAGASIATKENGESPMYVAAQLGNIVILQKILDVAQERKISYGKEERTTVLSKAILHNHQDALELLLMNGFSIEEVNSNKANVFHIATKHGRKEILEHLLVYDSNITKKLINMSDQVGPPLYYAVENNHPDCAELLISKQASVNVECENYQTTLLHIAARKNHCKIAEMIIANDSKTVHVSAKYKFGWTPLHEACHYGNREMITLLLNKGADLSGDSNTQPESPIQLLMKYVSKPTELVQEVFDSCISSKDERHKECSIVDIKSTIIVDYRVLDPHSENVEKSQMRVIQALLDTGDTHDQRNLLLHPLVESFVYRQWRSVSPFFYSSLVLHVFFVLSVNMFAFNFKYADRKIELVPNIFRISVWVYFIYISAVFITIQDIIFIKKNGIRNFWCMETWLRFLSTPLAIILPIIVLWDSQSQAEWVRLFSAVTLFFTWVKIMFLLSRFPKFGYYVLIYEKVARRVFHILVPLGLLIVGFCMSFMIQFHAQPPFEGFWSSLLMTMVMTSELGYKDTFYSDHELSTPGYKNTFYTGHESSTPRYKDTLNKDLESTSTIIMLRLTFAAFLFLCSIVLMKMLVGVAVNDVKDLELLGHRKRLEKQVEFITAFEGNACRNFVKNILPASLYKKWIEDKKLPNVIQMRSRCYDKCTRSNWHNLHARLREGIFEKAQSQQRHSHEKHDTMLYNMKLDEIYTVIVNNEISEPTTTQRLATLETVVNKVFEEICKLRRESADKGFKTL